MSGGWLILAFAVGALVFAVGSCFGDSRRAVKEARARKARRQVRTIHVRLVANVPESLLKLGELVRDLGMSISSDYRSSVGVFGAVPSQHSFHARVPIGVDFPFPKPWRYSDWLNERLNEALLRVHELEAEIVDNGHLIEELDEGRGRRVEHQPGADPEPGRRG